MSAFASVHGVDRESAGARIRRISHPCAFRPCILLDTRPSRPIRVRRASRPGPASVRMRPPSYRLKLDHVMIRMSDLLAATVICGMLVLWCHVPAGAQTPPVPAPDATAPAVAARGAGTREAQL